MNQTCTTQNNTGLDTWTIVGCWTVLNCTIRYEHGRWHLPWSLVNLTSRKTPLSTLYSSVFLKSIGRTCPLCTYWYCRRSCRHISIFLLMTGWSCYNLIVGKIHILLPFCSKMTQSTFCQLFWWPYFVGIHSLKTINLPRFHPKVPPLTNHDSTFE